MSKKIYVAYTGGTIGMIPSESGYVPGNNLIGLLNKKLPSDVVASLPEFELHEYKHLIDSSNISPHHWQQIASDIAGRYHNFDGFVVLHGTDTMAYSCSMISFMLQNLNKPIVFTGSQIPLCEDHTDGLDNFIGALTMAADNRIREVCLYFNNRLLRGNRSCKLNASRLDAFDSPNYPWLGHADTSVKFNNNFELNDKLLWRSKKPENILLDCDPNTNVAIMQLFPGITDSWMKSALSQPMDAFILRTYGIGNGPDSNQALLDTFARAIESGKLIVNLTQCYRGTVHHSNYATGSAMARVGIISGLDTTTEAMFCKLHHLYSQGMTTEQIKKMIGISLAGELSI